MRKSFSPEGKSESELIQMVLCLSSKHYRLEREKSLLRRILVLLEQEISCCDLPVNRKRIQDLIENALIKTDGRRRI